MNAPRRFGFSGRFGLAILAAWPSLVLGLSLTKGSPLAIILISLLGLPLALLGAITWLRAGQRHPQVFLQKRIMVAIYSAIIAAGLVNAAVHYKPVESGEVACKCVVE